jgi:gas vesicle protein
MDRVLNVLAGFFAGAAIGAGIVLLLAPRSGADTRQGIQDRLHAVVEEGRQAADARRRELLAELEARKQPAPTV